MTVVLFTCAGQRVDIVTAFRRAGATTVATDLSELAPALYAADHRELIPPVGDPTYIETVAALVRRYEASLVVPLTDLDHEVLAANRDAIPALVLLAGIDAIRRCADKWLAHCFFEEVGLPTPPTWLPDALPEDIPFPVFVKARRGFGSRGIYRASNRQELDYFLARVDAPSMVQQACAGEEFSIDVFCDLESRCLNAVPRTMIESKGGETIKGRTIKDRDLIEHGARVAEALGIVGPANVQCFREPDGRLPVTDVNPRFGGGFPLPTAAGSRYPELALELAAGGRPEPRLGEFEDGVVLTRYFGEMILHEVAGRLEVMPQDALTVEHPRGT